MQLEGAFLKNIRNWIRVFNVYAFFFILSAHAFPQVDIKYFNSRFVWIRVPSRFVKARLSKPINGESLCWVEVSTPKENFNFVSRRALPNERCMEIVMKSRSIIGRSKFVSIYGMGGGKDSYGNYSSMWDKIEGDNKSCHGYFDDYCENYTEILPEFNDWKTKPIDPKLYP